MASATETVVGMRGVTAVRNGWTVLRDVDWDLRAGEIHALVGEHRSGKSTLAGLLSGEAAKDAGELRIGGRRVEALSPRQARSLGISVVGQESRLIAGMTVAENILLGCRSFRPLFGRKMLREAERHLERLGVNAPPTARLRDLPGGTQRMVELAKAVVDDPRILILDEMPRRFTPEEMEKVYTLLKEWKSAGKSALFISPTLDEALEYADRVTFISGGRILGTEVRENLDRFRILNLTVPSLASRENLRQANIELYHYKRYNESLIRNLPIGVVIIDPQNRVNLVNEAAAVLLGTTPEALTGYEAAAVFSADMCRLALRRGDDGRAVVEDLDIGDTPTRVTAFPLRDVDDNILGTVALLENMAIDQRMKDYLVRVERIRSAAELAAGVAHEINNPLCVIRNYVELLKRQPDSAEAPKRLAKIGTELDWIVEIVGGMLSFAKPGDAPYRDMNLTAAVRDAVMLMGYRFRENGIDFVDILPEEAILVLGNENRLKQLFVNLLSNAIDAVGSGGSVRVEVRRGEGGEYAEVAVADNGPGVPNDVKEHIFNPFFTTKTSRHNTGLGLSICQQIADAHNGLLLVDHREGWTVFSFRIPLNAYAADA